MVNAWEGKDKKIPKGSLAYLGKISKGPSLNVYYNWHWTTTEHFIAFIFHKYITWKQINLQVCFTPCTYNNLPCFQWITNPPNESQLVKKCGHPFYSWTTGAARHKWIIFLSLSTFSCPPIFIHDWHSRQRLLVALCSVFRLAAFVFPYLA